MTHDIFISYSSKDQKGVEAFSAYLEQNSIRCFVAYREIIKMIEDELYKYDSSKYGDKEIGI